MNNLFNRDNLIVASASFGVGLMLSGQYIIGAAAVSVIIISRLRSRRYDQNKTSKLINERLNHKNQSNHEPTLNQKLRALDSWYYSEDGEVVGPVAEGQILVLYDLKAISESTLVYNSETGKEWRPFGEEFVRQNKRANVKKGFLKRF